MSTSPFVRLLEGVMYSCRVKRLLAVSSPVLSLKRKRQEHHSTPGVTRASPPTKNPSFSPSTYKSAPLIVRYLFWWPNWMHNTVHKYARENCDRCSKMLSRIARDSRQTCFDRRAKSWPDIMILPSADMIYLQAFMCGYRTAVVIDTVKMRVPFLFGTRSRKDMQPPASSSCRIHNTRQMLCFRKPRRNRTCYVWMVGKLRRHENNRSKITLYYGKGANKSGSLGRCDASITAAVVLYALLSVRAYLFMILKCKTLSVARW